MSQLPDTRMEDSDKIVLKKPVGRPPKRKQAIINQQKKQMEQYKEAVERKKKQKLEELNAKYPQAQGEPQICIKLQAYLKVNKARALAQIQESLPTQKNLEQLLVDLKQDYQNLLNPNYLS